MSEKQCSVDAADLPEAIARAEEIAILLYEADMSLPENQALREEVYALMDAFPENGNEIHEAGCRKLLAIKRQAKLAQPGGAGPEGYDGDNELSPARQIVKVDTPKINEELGRELTAAERGAFAITIDSIACGRTVDMTVAACEVFGGQVSDEVKRILNV